MKRIRPLRAVPVTAAVAAIAIACAACGGTSPSATGGSRSHSVPTGTTAGGKATAGHPRRAVAACLRSHGVSPARLAAAVGLGGRPVTGSTTVGATTLRSAGTACQSTLTPKTAGRLASLERCVTHRGVAVAHDGSPLADMLTLNAGSSRVQAAVRACVAEAKSG